MRLIFLAFLVLLSSCQGRASLTDMIDRKGFEWIGGTLFSSPAQVTMKEIHFENGNLLGKEVILEGDVIDVGKHTTHLVMNDGTARMLVVLTDVLNASKLVDGDKPGKLRVLGTVERGKKGLPFVQARSLNICDGEDASKV